MAKEPRRLRVYQQWQGNERFFCWGHCVTGPSWKSGVGSLILLLAPTVVFLIFVAPYMAERVTPAILVVSCILPVFCASMLLMTSCRDPGVLPRQEPDEEWLQGRKARAKDVMVNGHRVTVRYNDTCHFYQPPRAHHCSVNDNCIERFDHHCPWVGTTIGKRNYRTFLLFIYSTSIYIAWTFGVSLGSLFVRHKELVAAAGPGAETGATNFWLETLGQSGAAIALMVFSFIFFWFVCGLSGFHTWLVATNQTTYENFRYNHNQVPNPYDEGFFSNCASVWCVRVPPSKVDFRAYIEDVQKVPVELGYPEWTSQSMASPMQSPMRTALEAGQQGYPQAVPLEPMSGDAAAVAAAAAQEKLNQARLAGLGSREAILPVQGYDSMTEASVQAPITRTDGRSGHSMLASEHSNGSNTAASQQALHQNPYYTGTNTATAGGHLIGLQSPSAQQLQQQQQLGSSGVGSGSTAPGVQALMTGAATVPQQQQQQQGAGAQWGLHPEQQGPAMQRTFSPRGGFSPLGGNTVVAGHQAGALSAEHIGIELAGASNGGGSLSSKQQLQEMHPDTDLSAEGLTGLKSLRAVSPVHRTSTAAGSSAGGVFTSAAGSTATEYVDARQSEGSWASREDLEDGLNGK